MVRNLPRKFVVTNLLAEMQEVVPLEKINFISLPWENLSPSNLGFAFVNFVTPEQAQYVRAALNGKNWRVAQSIKTVKIIPARIQGLKRNIVHGVSALSTTLNDEYRPVVLLEGKQVDFDVITKVAKDLECEERTSPSPLTATTSSSSDPSTTMLPITVSSSAEAPNSSFSPSLGLGTAQHSSNPSNNSNTNNNNSTSSSSSSSNSTIRLVTNLAARPHNRSRRRS